MPICLIQTNLPGEQVPHDLHVKFSRALAEILNKPEEKITVTVSSGLQMVRAGSTDPTVSIHIWSIGVFGPDKNKEYAAKLFSFFRQELPQMPEKRIAILLHPIETHAAHAIY